jgi:hypothetical protein
MDIVKKNLVSIICGAVVLIAILLLFWPISGWFSSLQTEANGRSSAYSQVRDALSKERRLPVVSLEPNAEPPRLEQFPTPAVIERGQKVKGDIAAEKENIEKLAVKLNQGDKTLLVPKSLPDTRDRVVMGNFGREYTRIMDYMNPDPAKRKQSLPVQILRAGIAPTQAEILAYQQRVAQQIRQTETKFDEKTRRPINEQEVAKRIAEEQAKVPDALRIEAATENAMYLDPNSLTVIAEATQPNRPPQPPTIFWAQLTLWLQQDILKALAEVNGDSRNGVMDSPVKRLIKLDVTTQFIKPGMNLQGGQQQQPMNPEEGGGMPAEPTDPSQPIEKNYAVSPTGRYSNPLYDVLHFKLSLVVEASKVPQVLAALSRDRFITIYRMNVTAVDSGEAQAEGYIYGDDPVVLLDMEGEALFMRAWTKQYMPMRIKQINRIVDDPAATPQ